MNNACVSSNPLGRPMSWLSSIIHRNWSIQRDFLFWSVVKMKKRIFNSMPFLSKIVFRKTSMVNDRKEWMRIDLSTLIRSIKLDERSREWETERKKIPSLSNSLNLIWLESVRYLWAIAHGKVIDKTNRWWIINGFFRFTVDRIEWFSANLSIRLTVEILDYVLIVIDKMHILSVRKT